MVKLERNAFDALAAQAGFDPADQHMDELFPDVKALLERIAALEELDPKSAEPALTYTPREGA